LEKCVSPGLRKQEAEERSGVGEAQKRVKFQEESVAVEMDEDPTMMVGLHDQPDWSQ
jgi:hypothetical protein